MGLDPALSIVFAAVLVLATAGFIFGVFRLKAAAGTPDAAPQHGPGPPPPVIVEVDAAISKVGRLRGMRLVALEQFGAHGAKEKPGVRLQKAAEHLLDFADSIHSMTAHRRTTASLDESQEVFRQRVEAAHKPVKKRKSWLGGRKKEHSFSLVVRAAHANWVTTVTQPSQRAIPETLQALQQIPPYQVFELDIVVRR